MIWIEIVCINFPHLNGTKSGIGSSFYICPLSFNCSNLIKIILPHCRLLKSDSYDAENNFAMGITKVAALLPVN